MQKKGVLDVLKFYVLEFFVLEVATLVITFDRGFLPFGPVLGPSVRVPTVLGSNALCPTFCSCV